MNIITSKSSSTNASCSADLDVNASDVAKSEYNIFLGFTVDINSNSDSLVVNGYVDA